MMRQQQHGFARMWPWLALLAGGLFFGFALAKTRTTLAPYGRRRFGADARSSRTFDEGRDIVEQASWESFPASDPPAW